MAVRSNHRKNSNAGSFFCGLCFDNPTFLQIPTRKILRGLIWGSWRTLKRRREGSRMGETVSLRHLRSWAFPSPHVHGGGVVTTSSVKLWKLYVSNKIMKKKSTQWFDWMRSTQSCLKLWCRHNPLRPVVSAGPRQNQDKRWLSMLIWKPHIKLDFQGALGLSSCAAPNKRQVEDFFSFLIPRRRLMSTVTHFQ